MPLTTHHQQLLITGALSVQLRWCLAIAKRVKPAMLSSLVINWPMVI